MHAGDYANAETMKTKAVGQDPTLYYAKRSLVFLDMLCGRNRAAEEKLELLLGPGIGSVEQARFLAVRAFYHYRLGDLKPALQACVQGLEILKDGISSDAPHDELVWLKGLIELERRDLAAANAALARLRKMLDASSITAMNYKPAYKHWLHLLARIRAAEGKRDEALLAVKDLEWVKDKLGYWSTPYDHAFFMDSIGLIFEQLDLPQEAERAYRDALAYNPHYALAHFHLGRLMLGAGRTADARAQLDLFETQWATADANAPELLAARRLHKDLPEQRE
jgi:tetratricopeptide (TPR) repeat protein